MRPQVRFALDSPLEEAGFEPSVPLYILTVSDPLLVGPVTVPFAKRKSPVGDRVPSVRRLLPPPSIPPPPGGSPLARYRGGVISTHRPMGTPRARWCAPARSPPWFYGRACKTMLKGVSVARLTLWKPPAPITSRTRASPACAGRRTDLLRQRGRHADHHRTRVIKVGRPGSNGLRGGRLPSARRPSTRRPALAIVTCTPRRPGPAFEPGVLKEIADKAASAQNAELASVEHEHAAFVSQSRRLIIGSLALKA